MEKRERVDSLREVLKDKFILLPVKEIENLIPKDTLWKIGRIQEKFLATGKTHEWFIAQEFKGQNGLGKNLDALLDENVFGETSGTIKGKGRFCRETIKAIEDDPSWRMPDPINDLCEKILSFILKQNNIVERHDLFRNNLKTQSK
jgi:hypothetical protein